MYPRSFLCEEAKTKQRSSLKKELCEIGEEAIWKSQFTSFFYFRNRKNAAQAHRKLCGVYGDDCISERQCQNWFARFRYGNFDVKDD